MNTTVLYLVKTMMTARQQGVNNGNLYFCTILQFRFTPPVGGGEGCTDFLVPVVRMIHYLIPGSRYCDPGWYVQRT